MRTIDRLASIPGVSRLRDEAGRARRAIRARHPAVRLGLVLAPVVVLTAAGYWAAGSLATAGPRFLAMERAFYNDDLITVCRALDARGISYRPNDRRIEVAADQYEQAAAIVAKLDVGPQPVREIRESAFSFAKWFETTVDRERHEHLQQEKLLEKFINGLDGVTWSVVCLRHPRHGFAQGPRARTSAFVYLECDGDRSLPSKTIQVIPMILKSNEPDLTDDAITVMDRKGRPYLDPANPRLGKETLDQVRTQELRDQILERLNDIRGVRAWVDLADRGTPAPARPATDIGPASTVANGPADLGEPATVRAPSRVEKPESGHVLVSVPRSYYYSRMVPPPDHREPSQDELREVAARTKDQVERMVRPLIPASWTMDVETIHDELPVSRASDLPAGVDHRRLAADWGVIGAMAAAVALLMAMGSWIQASRRPAAIAAPMSGRRYREDPADEPEPFERVRELVRRDPEVAASVLQRWATQGVPTP